MGYTLKELKECARIITDNFNIPFEDSARIVGSWKGGKECGQILEGDLEPVADACALLGIPLSKTVRAAREDKPEAGRKNTKKPKRSEPTPKQETPFDRTRSEETPERVAGEVVPKDIETELPAEVVQRIEDAIQDYCARYAVEDLRKARQTQWKAVCMYVGRNVFKCSKILHDMERERTNGGSVYDVGKLSALLEAWAFLCASYDKAPFVDDFANFAGVSDSWIYGVGSKYGLTPARSALLQKLQTIQERGLAGLITDGRQNPTGALAVLNHWHGWTQTREVIHTDGRQTASDALPAFNLPPLPPLNGS